MTCPVCGSTGNFIIWNSVNADITPEIAQKVKDQSLFFWSCPQCRGNILVSYPCLYHDMSRRFMIQYAQQERDDGERIREYFPDYTYRWVDNLDALREKIRIFEQDFDDRVIEMMKFFLTASLREQNVSFINLFFWDVNREGQFVFQLETWQPQNQIQCNAKLYEIFTPDYLAHAAQASAVDQKWAQRYIETYGFPQF